MIPTVSMPIPAMALRVSAPPFGHCSETTPSMVGQKNVLPKPYKVAKMKIIAKPCAVDRKNKPRTANKDQIKNPDLIFPGQVFKLPTDN